MSDEMLNEAAIRKWKPVLDHADMPPITDSHRRATTAKLLENQERACREQMLSEALPTNVIGGGSSTVIGTAGNIAGYDPILIQLVRRAMPNLMAYDVCGVQAMSAPTGLIFAMRSKYVTQGSTYEAFFDEAISSYSGATAAGLTANGGMTLMGSTAQFVLGGTDPFAGTVLDGTGLITGNGLATSKAEDLVPNEMAFAIERVAVQAKTRALAASYSTELAQDLKAVHGLDAETELSNILSTEIMAELNREVIKTVYNSAVLGAQQSDLYYKSVASSLTSATSTSGGVYDLVQDSDGRWSAEKFRGLMFQIERECNVIAKATRRGKGNFIIVSADVASALAMGGFLNLSPVLTTSAINVDDTGNTFVGTLNGKIKVYVDPYGASGVNFVCVGYKGSSAYDAGLFYCPYVPLQMMRAVTTDTFQPKIAFKTRYGMVANPFSKGAGAIGADLTPRTNQYYRLFRVDNLHGVAS
jgi:Major capsid protein Gp23